MKRILFVALASAVLVFGCSSQPTTEDKVGVEDRTPTPAKPPASAQPGTKPQPSQVITAKPIAPAVQVQVPGGGAGPLKDPNNILSKRSIFYDYDSDAIKEEYRPMLQAHAKYLSDNRGARMLIQGNADERGSREYNIALGQRRAEAVKRLLVLLGAQDSQVESVSLGEEKPRCEEKTEACYAQNRRSDLLHSGEF